MGDGYPRFTALPSTLITHAAALQHSLPIKATKPLDSQLDFCIYNNEQKIGENQSKLEADFWAWAKSYKPQLTSCQSR